VLPSLVQPECEQAIKSCKELWQVISAGAASTEKFLSAATGSAGVGAAMGASGQKAHTKMAGLQAINKVLEQLLAAKKAEQKAFTLCQGTQQSLQNALQVPLALLACAAAARGSSLAARRSPRLACRDFRLCVCALPAPCPRADDSGGFYFVFLPSFLPPFSLSFSSPSPSATHSLSASTPKPCRVLRLPPSLPPSPLSAFLLSTYSLRMLCAGGGRPARGAA
jgi:hypothetical protein